MERRGLTRPRSSGGERARRVALNVAGGEGRAAGACTTSARARARGARRPSGVAGPVTPPARSRGRRPVRRGAMKRLGMTDPRISGFELSERVALNVVAGQARPAVVCKTSIEAIANAAGLAHGVVRSALREA